MRPTAFGVARLPIGMDDPRLAAQLAESASERPSGKDTVLTYRVVPVSASEALGGVAKCADDERTVTRPYWETDAGATDSTDGSGLPAADELATPEEATAIASAAEPVVAAGPRFRAVLLPTVAPLAVGMGLAYALASWGQNDPMDWTILGGALGLLVGLLCQRWARRRAD